MTATEKPAWAGLSDLGISLLYPEKCKRWIRSDSYKKDDYKEHENYHPCCEVLDYCSFYWQTWFICLCVGILLLFIVASIVACVCCCCRGGRGGGGLDAVEEKESAPSDDSDNTNPA